MKVYNIEETKLPKELEQTLARMITVSEKKMPYRKIEKGKYELYCPYCQTYKTISYSELQEVRRKKNDPSDYYHYITCPNCNERFSSTTNMQRKVYNDYVSIIIDGKDVGYHIVSEWEFGKPIKPIKISQYAFFDKDNTYIKCGYALACFGNKIVYNEDYNAMGKYRKSTSPRYSWNSLDYYNDWNWRYGSRYDKRKYLEDIFNITKSSQVKMLMQFRTLESKGYAYAIKLFDINNYDELEKHTKYIDKNIAHLKDFKDTVLNTYYLDYLNRNNIDLGDYFEYSQNLKKLGFKLDKPTDFKHRFDVIDQMATAEEDKAINEKITKRYNKLPKYEKGNVLISPFDTAQHVRRCGKKLHNCIGGYVQRYADNETDLYHVDINGALTIAIEIRNMRLQQAYGNNNSKCPNDIMKHIKSFCKTNGFSLGNYA